MRRRVEFPLTYFIFWLASGERGRSSDAIVSHLTNRPVGMHRDQHVHPKDPSDLIRCVKLLDQHPLARMEFEDGAMRDVSPEWARLTDHWGELVALLREEQAECTGRAPRCYARMQQVLRGES